jgi:hypothetical protein
MCIKYLPQKIQARCFWSWKAFSSFSLLINPLIEFLSSNLCGEFVQIWYLSIVDEHVPLQMFLWKFSILSEMHVKTCTENLSVVWGHVTGWILSSTTGRHYVFWNARLHFFSGDNQHVFRLSKALGLTIACPQSLALPYKYWTWIQNTYTSIFFFSVPISFSHVFFLGRVDD